MFHFQNKFKWSWKSLKIKGQIISKRFFLAEDSSKKRTKTRRILVKTNSFVRFLEESSAWQFAFEINWPLIKVSCFGKLKSYILPAKKISQQGQYLRKKKLFGQATWSPLRSTPRKIKCYLDFFFFYFWPWTHSASKWLKSAKNGFTSCDYLPSDFQQIPHDFRFRSLHPLIQNFVNHHTLDTNFCPGYVQWYSIGSTHHSK